MLVIPLNGKNGVMQRIDLDHLQDSRVQYAESQEYEDHYRVECVSNSETDVVLNASIVSKIVGSRTERIDSCNLSIFHFFPLPDRRCTAKLRVAGNQAPCAIVFDQARLGGQAGYSRSGAAALGRE